MIYPRARERMAEAVGISMAGVQVCLFANDVTPNRSTNAMTLHEATGYRPHVLTAGAWIQDAEGVAYPPVVLTVAEAQTIYGPFLRAIDGGLIAAERFDEPIDANPGDEITINIRQRF